ncbi:hypothetical protein D9M68_965060 [compost metagenome]
MARGCGVPLGRRLSLSTFVRSSVSDISILSFVSRSSRPGPDGKPSVFMIDGLETSASTSRTV